MAANANFIAVGAPDASTAYVHTVPVQETQTIPFPDQVNVGQAIGASLSSSAVTKILEEAPCLTSVFAFLLLSFSHRTAMSNDGSAFIVSGVEFAIVFSNGMNPTVFEPSAVDQGLGTTVAMSGDGATIAIASTADQYSSGRVQVYRLIDGTWEQLGPDIVRDGEFGGSMAMNNNGNVIAIGAPGDNVNTGRVSVFVLAQDGSTWDSVLE